MGPKGIGVAIVSKGVGVATTPKGIGVATIPKGIGVATVSKGIGAATDPKGAGVAIDPKGVGVATCIVNTFQYEHIPVKFLNTVRIIGGNLVLIELKILPSIMVVYGQVCAI